MFIPSKNKVCHIIPKRIFILIIWQLAWSLSGINYILYRYLVKETKNLWEPVWVENETDEINFEVLNHNDVLSLYNFVCWRHIKDVRIFG